MGPSLCFLIDAATYAVAACCAYHLKVCTLRLACLLAGCLGHETYGIIPEAHPLYVAGKSVVELSHLMMQHNMLRHVHPSGIAVRP